MQQTFSAEQSRSFDKRGCNPNLRGGKMLREDNEGRPAIWHRKFKDQENDSVGSSTTTQEDHTETGIRYTDRTAESSGGMKKYRGVYFNKTQGMWNTRIYLHAEKKQVSLGVYRTAEMAAVAHDTGFLFLRGQSDGLNFPEFASLLPRPLSNSRNDIRSAAQMAAWYLTPQIIQGQMRREYLEASTVIWAPTSAPRLSLSTGTITARVYLHAEKKQMSLGVYRTAEMAAVAHDTGFLFLRGQSDGLNFPEFASLLPRPLSNSRNDIRSAAQMAGWYLTPHIIQGQMRREYLEASTVIWAPTSAPRLSLSTGTITARAQQQPEQIHDENKEIRNNQQIQYAHPQTCSSTTACPRICSSCLIHQKYTALNIIQAAAIRTSNPNSLAVEMESFDGDHAMDDVVLIEYPVRHSPECVLLRPVPGVDIPREYIWKK